MAWSYSSSHLNCRHPFPKVSWIWPWLCCWRKKTTSLQPSLYHYCNCSLLFHTYMSNKAQISPFYLSEQVWNNSLHTKKLRDIINVLVVLFFCTKYTRMFHVFRIITIQINYQINDINTLMTLIHIKMMVNILKIQEIDQNLAAPVRPIQHFKPHRFWIRNKTSALSFSWIVPTLSNQQADGWTLWENTVLETCHMGQIASISNVNRWKKGWF